MAASSISSPNGFPQSSLFEGASLVSTALAAIDLSLLSRRDDRRAGCDPHVFLNQNGLSD
jgi:hypothetical protein